MPLPGCLSEAQHPATIERAATGDSPLQHWASRKPGSTYLPDRKKCQEIYLAADWASAGGLNVFCHPSSQSQS